MWPFNKEFGFWNEWRGHFDGTPVFYSRTLFRIKEWKICIHKMVEADLLDCFHTHPATAWRIILWGGYSEEIRLDSSGSSIIKKLRPCYIGKVKPEFTHRIYRLTNKTSSFSLWVRGPITHQVKLIGKGWGDKETVIEKES